MTFNTNSHNERESMLVWAMIDKNDRTKYATQARYVVVHNDGAYVEIAEMSPETVITFRVKKSVFEEFFTACKNTRVVNITEQELRNEQNNN